MTMTTDKTYTRGSALDRNAYHWAAANQEYTGSWEDWLALPLAERQEYEAGACGSDEPKQVVEE